MEKQSGPVSRSKAYLIVSLPAKMCQVGLAYFPQQTELLRRAERQL